MVKKKFSTEILCFGTVFILFAAGYADVFLWMMDRYMGEDSYYSHGFLVPFISLYLIWTRRAEFYQKSSAGSKTGLLLICLSVLLHVFGTSVYVFSISGFALWLFIIGFVLFVFGWGITRILLQPILFLLFMIPLPLALINAVSFPLKILVAHIGTKMVALAGVPVFREGFTITIPQGALLVGNPCSGLRSLIAFMALGFLFAYLSRMTDYRKILLFLLSIPIAIVSNLIRVPLLILWSYKWGLESAAPDTAVHTGSGILVFVMGMVMLFFTQQLLERSHEK